MYRLEHYSKNATGAEFITVDDATKNFIAGNTAACASDVGQDFTVTTHATSKEITELADSLMQDGYTPHRADYLDSLLDFVEATGYPHVQGR